MYYVSFSNEDTSLYGEIPFCAMNEPRHTDESSYKLTVYSLFAIPEASILN